MVLQFKPVICDCRDCDGVAVFSGSSPGRAVFQNQFLGLSGYPVFRREQATTFLPAVSSLAICLIVIIVIAANAHRLLSSGWIIVLVVMLHNVLGLTIGYLIGAMLKLSPAKRRAISVEVGMQNSGLASSLATLHFASYPMAAIPGAVFSVWHNISGAIVARIYSRHEGKE